MRLSRDVEEMDVTDASNLIREATLTSCIDPATGLYDMDGLQTGKSSASKARREELARAIEAYILANASKYRSLTNIRKFYE